MEQCLKCDCLKKPCRLLRRIVRLAQRGGESPGQEGYSSSSKKGENSWWGESLPKECNDKIAQYSRLVLDILQDHKNLGFHSWGPSSSWMIQLLSNAYQNKCFLSVTLGFGNLARKTRWSSLKWKRKYYISFYLGRELCSSVNERMIRDFKTVQILSGFIESQYCNS